MNVAEVHLLPDGHTTAQPSRKTDDFSHKRLERQILL